MFFVHLSQTISMQVLSVALLVLATQSSALVVLESDVSPAGAASPEWTLGARATAADTLTLTAVLRRDAAALAELEQTFWAVSDPTHARYGQHLSQADVTALVAPPAAALERTLAWLQAWRPAAEG